jgi:hypothetical protein
LGHDLTLTCLAVAFSRALQDHVGQVPRAYWESCCAWLAAVICVEAGLCAARPLHEVREADVAAWHGSCCLQPGYFGKVGMRYFHLNKNKYTCPIINLDKVRRKPDEALAICRFV